MPYIIYQTLSGELDEATVFETISGFVRSNELLETENIFFHNETFNGYENAERFLQSFDTTGGNHAVKYKDTIKNTIAYQKTYEHYNEAVKKYEELLQQYYFETYNRTEIECKNCGSKLNSQYMKRKKAVLCLVCHEDLRPQAWFNKLIIAKERIDYCQQKIKNMENIEKIRTENGISDFWLVKYAVLENYQEGTKIYEM